MVKDRVRQVWAVLPSDLTGIVPVNGICRLVVFAGMGSSYDPTDKSGNG